MTFSLPLRAIASGGSTCITSTTHCQPQCAAPSSFLRARLHLNFPHPTSSRPRRPLCRRRASPPATHLCDEWSSRAAPRGCSYHCLPARRSSHGRRDRPRPRPEHPSIPPLQLPLLPRHCHLLLLRHHELTHLRTASLRTAADWCHGRPLPTSSVTLITFSLATSMEKPAH
nr:uncharacterized protein LOC120966406 [Aegilops tauschii subsp. strangulata]